MLALKAKDRKEPKPGTAFRHTYKGILYTLTVVKTEEGIGYELLGKTYKSPTAATKAIVGNQYINGRKFWHIDD